MTTDLLKETDGFEVIITGSGAPGSVVKRANPSTLVRFEDKYFLVDCGYGTCMNLEKLGLGIEPVTNIIFTHQHEDHNADFMHFLMAGWYDIMKGRKHLNIIGPQVKILYDCAITMCKDDIDGRIEVGAKQGRQMPGKQGISKAGILEDVNVFETDKADESFIIDGVNIDLHKVLHGNMKSYSIKFKAKGKTVIVTGDVAFTEDLIDFYKDADVVVAEALTLTGVLAKLPEGVMGTDTHMTKTQLAKVFGQCKPKKLILTHAKDEFYEPENIEKVFRENGFDGELYFAVDGMAVRA